MRKPVKHLLSAAAVLITMLPAAAFASLTRIAGPTGVITDGRLVDKIDVAFDYDRQVYLAVWGTFSYGPTNGQFLAADGSPLGAPFVISDGSPQAGWARVVYGGGKFLVSYTKILGTTTHRRSARFITYVAGSPSAPSKSAEIEIDTWSGGAGDASGMAYSNGRYLVTWWNWNHDPPQSYVTILDAAGGFVAYKKHVSTFGDGQTDPEIACDAGRGRCLIIGGQWGVFNPGWTPGTWGQFINDATGDRIGGGFTISYGSIQKEATVTYSTAGDRYLVTFSRFQHTVYGTKINGATTAVMDETMLRNAAQSPEGVGYGMPKVSYNPSTQTSVVAMMPWIGRTAVLELDRDGWTTDASFQFVPGVSNSDYNNGTKTVASATDPVNGRFLAADIQAFLHMRSTVFSAAGGSTTPPPSSPPPSSPPPPPSCSVSASPGTIVAGGFGGAASVTVSATGDCAWTATSGAGWMAISSGSSGNGNGKIGFNIARNNTGAVRSGSITVGGATVTIQQPNYVAAAVHDLSGDGLSDIVWHNRATGHAAVWNLRGMNVIGTYYLNGGNPIEFDWKLSGSGDLNGDGFADLIWRNLDGRLAAWPMQDGIPQAAQVLIMPGGATAVQHDPGWQIRAVGDLDGDGKADLIWQHSILGTLAVWFMDGFNVTRTQRLSISAVPDPNWQISGAGDINGDGRADLLWQHHGTGQLAAWLMNGATVGTQSVLSTYVTDLDWKVRGVGDVNGDGYADLIWQNITTGGLGVWYLQNFAVTQQHGLSIWGVTNTNWHVIGPG